MQKSLVIGILIPIRIALALMLAVSIVGCSSHNFSVRGSGTLTENSQNFRIDLDSISRSLFQKDSVFVGRIHWMEYHPQLVINVDTSGGNHQPTGINNKPTGMNRQSSGMNRQSSGMNRQPTVMVRVDTIVIRDSVIAYRLKHVRDSAKVIERDTIPVVQRVEVVKEVQRARNWFDWMCYGVTGLVVLGIVAYACVRWQR